MHFRSPLVTLVFFTLIGPAACMRAERLGTDTSTPEGFLLGSMALASSPAAPVAPYSGAPLVAVGPYASGHGCVAWHSFDGSTWVQNLDALPGCTYAGNAAKAVVFGDGVWIAVGQAGASNTCAIWSSRDGVSWVVSHCPDVQVKNAIAYGGGRFLSAGFCSGENHVAMVSSDGGETWTSRFHAAAGCSSIVSAAYDTPTGSFWLADSTTTLLQFDGTGWTEHDSPLSPAPSVGTIRFGSGATSAVVTWADSSEAMRQMIGTPGNWSGHQVAMAVSGGKSQYAWMSTAHLVLTTGAFSSALFVSGDRTNWTSADMPLLSEGAPWTGLAYSGAAGAFVATGYDGMMPGPVFARSGDGLHWTTATSFSDSPAVNGIAAAN